MKDKELDEIDRNFKRMEIDGVVQSGEIESKNGSSINCHLLIKRKISAKGQEFSVGYEVLRVTIIPKMISLSKLKKENSIKEKDKLRKVN